MENAEIYYILCGGAILAAYMLIYLLRVKRSRRMEEYMREMGKRSAEKAEEGERQITGVTREDIQGNTEKPGD